MSSPNYPPKTCALEGCDRPLMRRNESIAEWARRKYCSLRCVSRSQRGEITHGTHNGYQQHCRRDETPCEDCRQAEIAYRDNLRTSDPETHRWHRARQSARMKALRRLAGQFPREFDALFERELGRLLERNDRLVTAQGHPGRRSPDSGSGNTGER
jgi:hypothetical protein